MELNNISSFNEFKKILERSIPDEFSNKTGFSESLVGRGLFSLLRYFKQGIDLGRLEYLKRKLENEYFAGWLRFCAINNIDIKEGKLPEEFKKVEHDDTDDSDDSEIENNNEKYSEERVINIIEPVFKFDYTKNEELINYKKDFEKYIEEIKKIENAGEDSEDLKKILDESDFIIKMIDFKTGLNLIFDKMTKYSSQPGIELTQEREQEMISGLSKIESFLNKEAKSCPNYNLTINEKEALRMLSKCKNESIVKKCNDLLGIKESIKYKNSNRINEEAISSSINTKIPIMQILGDTLNVGETSKKVNPYEYLKSIGINNVDEINFKACAEIWRNNPSFRDGVSKLVSLEGVRKIQYAAARIIFRIKKTPTYTGITPEKGGGVDKGEDSALRTAWERKVEKCKGEWVNFMNFESYEIDPFKAMNIQDAIRDKSSDPGYTKPYKDMMDDTRRINENYLLQTNADKLGLIPVLSSPFKVPRELVLMQVQYGNDKKIAYILCNHYTPKGSDEPPHIYVYWGNVDLHKIITDKLYDKPDFKSTIASSHSSSIISSSWNNKGCVDLNEYLDLSPDIAPKAGYKINGYFFGSSNFNRYKTAENAKTQTTHFMHLYVDEKFTQTRNKFDTITDNIQKNNIDLYITNSNSRREIVDLNAIRSIIEDTKTMKWEIGSVFKFKDPTWGKSYFPDWDDITLKKEKLVIINNNIYKDKIKLI